MSRSLTGEQRTLLEKLVQKARRTFEDDMATTLEGRYGIHTDDGHVEPTDAISLPAAGLAVRTDLVDLLDYLRAEGASPAEATQRLVREAAFTHLNRLIAVRVAEAIGLMPATLSRGLESAGFRDFSEIAPAAAASEWERYALFVRLCADELATDVPALFDPRNPLLELEPSTSALAEVVELIVGAPDELWEAPDTLGWAYQFFNTGAERKAMREKPAPSNSRELAVRNQFFTPDYVVEFLVHNGLGAHLAAGVPGLADDLHMLVEEPTETIDVDLAAISVLDPACGSGHFLLGAYDVLERAWELTGVSPDEAAPAILQSLWGIDIDPRATQIAQAAVIFRARRHRRRGALPPPNVIAARALPTGPATDELIAELPERVGRAVRAIADELVDAPILGPLLKIEERLDIEARDLFGTGEVAGTLAEAADDTESIEAAILDALSRIAGGATSSAGHRLFAAEAVDAVRFVEAMSRRYTAVLMNPPFGAPVRASRSYLESAFHWAPATCDMYALFVGRGIELCMRGGSVGAITSRTGLFLQSFSRWRRDVLAKHGVAVLLDLGEKVMEQATVEAAAYVVRHQSRGTDKASTIVLRCMSNNERIQRINQLVASARLGRTDQGIYRSSMRSYEMLLDAPFPYWVRTDTVRKLAEHSTFEPSLGRVRQGLSTGDNFRFVRAWWEVSSESRSSSVPGKGPNWPPLVMGGSSQPWFSPLQYVIKWGESGYDLSNFRGSVLRNVDDYFKPGFSWTRRAPRLVPYIVPAGAIPTASRYQAFAPRSPNRAIGIAASRVASAYCRFYGEKFLWPNFLVDNLKQLRVPDLDDALSAKLASHVKRATAERRRAYSGLETTREFLRPSVEDPGLDWNPYSILTPELEAAIASAYGLDDRDLAEVCLDLDECLDALSSSEEELDDDDEVLKTTPGWPGRFISYSAGVAFGRWDLRAFTAEASRLSDPFDPLPANPPGMLVDSDGMPVKAPPVGYPVDFPVYGLYVDEDGHPQDFTAAVWGALELLEGVDAEDVLRALSSKQNGLRRYLQREFFKTHLATYSQGPRKAPIYWQLQVPSKQWGLWLYAPKLSREMLFGIVREAEQRLRLAEQQVAHLQRELDDGTSGRKTSAVAKELEAEQKLLGELTTFRAEAERIANLGWEPDLDDGMVLNAAPLADMFPAWKDAAKYREELRAGKYEWATVARYAGEL